MCNPPRLKWTLRSRTSSTTPALSSGAASGSGVAVTTARGAGAGMSKKQAALCAGAFSASGGRSAHTGWASAQRGANGQPERGWVRSGGAPGIAGSVSVRTSSSRVMQSSRLAV